MKPNKLPKPRMGRVDGHAEWYCWAPGTFTRWADTPTLAYKRWLERNSRKGSIA